MPDEVLRPSARAAAERMAADLERVFGTRLQALIAYDASGQGTGRQPPLTHSLALVESLADADLTALLTVVPAWHKSGLATPLLLTAEEFLRTLDAFPLEYASILERHVLLRGALPQPFSIAEEDLRRACERQVKAHLIHLREGYLETHGRPAALAELLRASIPPFRSSLIHVARLHGSAAADDAGLATFAAETLGTDGNAAGDLLRWSEGGQVSEASSLFPRYLRLVQRLWTLLDGWAPTP